MNTTFRLILCVILPPIAVLDKGCGAVALVTLGTFLGWLPGVVLALIISLIYNPAARIVTIPDRNTASYFEQEETPLKRQPEYVTLADGAWAELIDDDFDIPDDLYDDPKQKRSN